MAMVILLQVSRVATKTFIMNLHQIELGYISSNCHWHTAVYIAIGSSKPPNINEWMSEFK